jgi:DNA-binding winged helix-turn-helix (wHTH) protein/tetratricopeptide (TPR) repeat protein
VTSEGDRHYRFGPFELDVANAELRRDGAVVKLAPQPFTVLRTLLDRPGALVTRDELRRVVWGDQHHVDFNAGLNFCLAQIRTALDESTTDPVYIVTVPRRGYKFLAAVETVPAGPPTETEAVPGAAGPTPGGAPVSSVSRKVAAWTLASAASLAVVAFLLWRPPTFAAATPGSSSLPAVTAYERAALDLADASPGELQIRVRLFDEAIGHDPTFARAYAGLAEARLMLAEYRGEPPQRAYAMAKAAAQRALALDPDLADAHAAMAAVLWQFNWDWDGAERHVRQALRGTPSPAALVWASRFRAAQGRSDEALSLAGRAVALTPRTPRAHVTLGMTAIFAGDYARAVEACQRALALMSKFTPADMCLVTAAAETNRLPLAAGHLRAGAGGEVVTLDSFGALWRARLAQLDQRRASCQCDDDAVSFAVIHARLGETDRALTWLERAAELHADSLVYAAVHPAFRPLRDEQRFGVVLDRVGVPSSAVRTAGR